MKNKIKIVLSFLVSALVILGLFIYLANATGLSTVDYGGILLILLLVGGATAIMLNKTKDVKAGLPMEDELSKKMGWKAGYYTYLTTLWIVVGLIWYDGLSARWGMPDLSTEELLGAVVLLSGVVFIGLYFYFSRRGD